MKKKLIEVALPLDVLNKACDRQKKNRSAMGKPEHLASVVGVAAFGCGLGR